MKSGYDADKMNFQADIGKGEILNVPILTESPVNFELEVAQSIPLEDGEVFLCRIKNVLYDEMLADESSSVGERLRTIAPVSTTCETYFSYTGEVLGAWGEPGKGIYEKLTQTDAGAPQICSCRSTFAAGVADMKTFRNGD